jgi:hypothetical protein
MSGPKVIRTVTIEQLREEARVQLALVAESIRLWQKAAAGRDEATSSRLGRLIEEQNWIEVSLQADRFSDVATRSQAVVGAIRQDIQRLHEEQDARNARFRVQKRSLRLTAKSVLERCRRMGLVIPKDHQDKLKAAANGQAFDVQEIATIAARWLEEVSGSDHRRKTDAQEALARSLSGTSRESSAGELLRHLEAEIADPRINAAEKQLAELARLGEQEAVEQFGQRLSTIVSCEPGSNSITRALAFDSLGLELSRAVKLARERAKLVTELASEVAAATATNDLKACQQAILEAERALETRHLEQGRALIERIREIRETCQRVRAANAARQTILSGLKKLGYEVREGMLTTWAEKKRLAIRHPDRPGVALELAGSGDSGRMQTRMVAVEGAARDSRSDKQVEEEWCGNLKTLQEAVANTGGTVQIEKALAAGIQPLKVISDEWQDVATTIHKPREREQI